MLVKAFDRAGNAAQDTARILIPAPNATLTPHSSFSIPQSSFTPPSATATAASVFSLPAQPAPTATRTASLSAFQSPNLQSNNLQSNNLQSHNLQSSAPLFGAAALSAIAAATALALAERKRRKDEEARQAAEAQRKAAARNAAEALQRIQNWLIGQQIKKAQEEQHRAMDAKIERMEDAEGAALAAAMKPPVKPQRDEQAYQSYRAGERADAQPAAQPKSWWQRAGEWIQDKVDKFVMHPPSWLSVSWSSGDFSLGNYTLAHWVSYQPLARNLWEGISYQKIPVEAKVKSTLTVNPDGMLDIDFSNGTITFQGKERSVFVQPFALSFGWKSALKPQVVGDKIEQSVSITSVDFDLLGTNWCSLKISHGQGTETKTISEIDRTKIEKSDEISLDVTMQVHRWPRLVAIAGAVYVIFQVGVLEAVTTAGPVLLERLSTSAQQLPALVNRLLNLVQQGVAP